MRELLSMDNKNFKQSAKIHDFQGSQPISNDEKNVKILYVFRTKSTGLSKLK